MLVFAAGVVAMNFFVTLYLQQVLDYSALQAGLCFLPMALGQIVFSTLASKLLAPLGVPRVMLIGLASSAVALAWFALISPDGSFLVDVLGPAVLLSVGGGFSFVAVVVSAISGVAEMEQGLAGGLINMSQQVGGALGLAALSSLATWRTNHLAGNSPISATDLNSGFRLGLIVAAGLIAIVAVAGPLALRTPAPVADDVSAADPIDSAGETVVS
jgi:Na+/melibiose symporter-like transporter